MPATQPGHFRTAAGLFGLRGNALCCSLCMGMLTLAAAPMLRAQQAAPAFDTNEYVPVLSGSLGYVHHVEGGRTTLEPQIEPVLLVPFGSRVLLESRAEFTSFLSRRNGDRGPFSGKVFKTVDYAQLDWLANTHANLTLGRYLLPFGEYNERLAPLWIRNLQDFPITYPIGTRTSGSGDGVMLRGVLAQRPAYSIQYTSYFSASSKINELEAGRAAGGDGSIYLTRYRLELGSSYQRFLEGRRINSAAAYVSWQPASFPLDLKAEYDGSYYGRGYWIEGAYRLSQITTAPRFFSRVQLVERVQQFVPSHGGGNSLPAIDTQRFDSGLNYYLRDDLRFVSSYGRSFSSQKNANIWNVGFTYRFVWPLWPGRHS